MDQNDAKIGTLYLLPTPLGDAPASLSPEILEYMDTLTTFITERARTSRRLIKQLHPSKNISELEIFELNKHDPSDGIASFLQPALKGVSIGLLSEAGCPGVADPGALVVAKAHDLGIPVKPIIGPSSILLALMASGMTGQQFCFNGYLPAKKPELSKALRKMEQRSRQSNQTEIFIEAPYRNEQMINTAKETLNLDTRFSMAVDLTLPTEEIISKNIVDWMMIDPAKYQKRPAIFMLAVPRFSKGKSKG